MSGQQYITLGQHHVTRWEIDLCHKFRGQMQRDINEQFVVFNPLSYETLQDKSIVITVQINVNRYVRMNFSKTVGNYNNDREEELRKGDTYTYIGTKANTMSGLVQN